MSGHAYLITAYENSYVLDRLLNLLDDKRNHIYLHVDKNARHFDFGHVGDQCAQAEVTFVPRVKVSWGHYSQVESVFSLLRHATLGKYSYYHLLSGSDLPLKSQDRIYEFFGAHDGEEFVGFAPEFDPELVAHVHPAMRYVRSGNARVQRIANGLEQRTNRWQRRMGYDRTARLPQIIRKGSDWFSITHALALHVLSQERMLRRVLKWAAVPTEFYVQTAMWNSQFRHRAHDLEDELGSSARYIDWSNSVLSPRVLTTDDFPRLVASDRMFARKFDAAVDRDVIDMVHDHVVASSRAG